VAGFDITTLNEFAPPAARCPRCLGLWVEDYGAPRVRFSCPVCSAEFQPPAFPILSNPTGDQIFDLGGSPFLTTYSSMYGYVFSASPGLRVDLGENPLSHATGLAQLAAELRGADDDHPPLQSLMRLLLAARSFIHITTFGLDEFTLGLLELAAQRVLVSTTVSGLDDKMIKVLAPASAEAPALEVRVEGGRHDPGDQNHGKLIVVDGLLAVTGSTNFTHKAWRKAAVSMEIVEVVTDVRRVSEFNNRYFAPTWARLAAPDTRQSLSGWLMLTPDDPEHPAQQHARLISPSESAEGES
jgi:phospholipase D-like protein